MSAASSCRSSSAWGIDLASAELVFAGPDIDLYQPRREPGSSRVDQISYRRCCPETPPGFADSDRGGCCRGYPDSSPDLLHACTLSSSIKYSAIVLMLVYRSTHLPIS